MKSRCTSGVSWHFTLALLQYAFGLFFSGNPIALPKDKLWLGECGCVIKNDAYTP